MLIHLIKIILYKIILSSLFSNSKNVLGDLYLF